MVSPNDLSKDYNRERMRKWIFNVLDENNPLENYATSTHTEAQSIHEFCLWRPDAKWCPEIRSLILKESDDMFKEYVGDEQLYKMFEFFNICRRDWVIENTTHEEREAKTKAKAYLQYVTRANTATGLKSVVSFFTKTRTISADEINFTHAPIGVPVPGSEVIGTEMGVVHLGENELLWNPGEPVETQSGTLFRVTKSTRGTNMNVSRFVTDYELELMEFPSYDTRWDEFILEIMCGDQERADYLQRALGYSLHGGNPEECMFIAYGATTRNGKGTLLNTVAYVLNEYAGNMPSNFLTRKSNGMISNPDDALGALEGKRFVTMSEPVEGEKLNEAKVKELTGNDPITVARKYCPTRTFMPQFTMWMSCNALPSVDDTTVFTSGRLRVIPFERHFSEEEQDKDLKSRFRSREGCFTVMTWLCEGYKKWYDYGLNEPESIRQMTEQWASTGGDDFRKFIDECCVLEFGKRTVTTDFHEACEKWLTDNELHVPNKQEIRVKLQAMSVPKSKIGGINYYKGIALK